MKDFFKKILAFLRKLWDKFVTLLYKIPVDKKMHFWAGFLIAAFFAIALGMKLCFWPVLFFALGKEFFDKWTTGVWDWWDFAATMFGSLIPQAFALLNLWWF